VFGLLLVPALKNSAIDVIESCGGDLANRFFGARLLGSGFSPYFLPPIENLAPELIQPNTDFPGLSGTTIAPTFLLMLIPFAAADYYQLRIIWWALGWILLGGVCMLGYRMTKDPQQRLAVILLGLMVSDSYFWRLHSERGQYYIFVAFLISLETFYVIHSKKLTGWALGLGIVLRPSLIIALPIAFLVSGWRSAARSLGVFLVFFITSVFLWGIELWQQYIANSSVWRLCVTDGNCLKQWGPTVHSAADTIPGCKTVLGIPDKSATFTAPIMLDLLVTEQVSTIVSALMLVGMISLCTVDSTTKCNFDKRLVAKDVLVSKASRPASQSSHDLSTP
jgi:hypothetical protein